MKSAILTILSIACIASYSAPQATYSVATNISEGVTRKIVTKQFVEGLGVVSTDTNAVRDIAREEIIPATNSLYTTLNGSIDVKRDKTDLAVYEVVRIENTDWSWTSENAELADELNAKGTKPVWIAEEGFWDDVSPLPESFIFDGGDFSSGRDSLVVNIKFSSDYYEKVIATARRPRYMDETLGPAKENQQLAAVATRDAQTPANGDLVKYDATNDRFVKAVEGVDYLKTHQDISGKLDTVNHAPGQDFHTVLWGDDGRLNVIGGLFATSIETYALLVFDGFMINAESLPQEQKNWNLIKIQIGQGNFLQ